MNYLKRSLLLTLMEIEIDHITYLDQQTDSDINNDRLWFIAKQFPKDDYTFNEAKKLANYWINKQMLRCTYSAPIEKKLKEVEKQLYS